MASSKKKIYLEGWRALVEHLGPAGATRFILQYERGSGDYVKLRKKRFKDVTLDDLVSKIREYERKSPHHSKAPV